ncbi:acetyltransferase (GNAT) family protein [Haloactinopolyspora alba]|uniref:Acetyltransferase (GNAT) family protein n=2 Tax=Haloactinopolyspora alba TaxID=648780 RepID=A0A2P8E7K8_9ACTN|nr:acetyltransferase (GNAT) family protein [Haloactinopolyspora alba]
MTWIFPDPATRLDAVAAWLGLFVETDAGGGNVDTLDADGGNGDTLGTDGPAAAAVWPAHREPASGTSASGSATSGASALPTISGLLVALVGQSRATEVGQGLAGIRRLTPTTPHAYLHFAAVAPEQQRRGLGRRVVEPGLRRAEQAGLGVHLETTNQDNLAFYRQLGFEVSGEVHLAPDGPTMWAMWRDPVRG